MNSFWTIKTPTEGFFKDRGSKFYGLAFPVKDEAEVKQKLDAVKKQYHDARHHCYAFVLGMKTQQTRANDDGEPGHSAGDPILGQIRSFELTNTLVVVVRYFGGTKLGVGGLIQAYKTAAEEALQKADKQEIFPVVRFRISYAYDETAMAERLLGAFELEVLERKYEAACEVIAEIREELYPQLIAMNEPPHQVAVERLDV